MNPNKAVVDRWLALKLTEGLISSSALSRPN